MKNAVLLIILLALSQAFDSVSLSSISLEFGHITAFTSLFLLGMVTAGPAVAHEPTTFLKLQ